MGRVEFTDDGNVDFTTTGVGTLNDPLTVFASAELALTDLTDVSSTPPAVGEMPVWRGDHWEFEPAIPLPPGGTDSQVLTKQSSLDGDADWEDLPAGSAPPSGVWGTAPLTEAVYGVGNALNGREIYVDTAGQLRAKPDLITGAPAEHPVTALPTTYPTGTSVMYVASADSAAWPPAASCIVVTSKAANHATVQWCGLTQTGNTKTWVRDGLSSAWGPWIEITAPNVTELGAGIDLNTVTASGFYTQSQNAETSKALNYPDTWAGELEVIVNSTGQMVWQRYTVYGHTQPGGNVTWTRGAYLGTWTPWVSVGYVSGVWGTAPLDATTYNADSLVGSLVYRDSLGQLRVQPDVLSGNAAKFPVTALATVYPTGTTVMYIGSADGGPWPSAGACVVVTSKATNSATSQWCYINGATRAWVRYGNSTAWQAWIEVAGPGLNKKQAAGRTTCTFAGAATSNTTTVTFPAGLFSVGPRVSLCVVGSSLFLPYCVQAPIAASMQIALRHFQDLTQASGTISIDWIATEE